MEGFVLEHKYDVAVIGGGPGGYTAAIRAAQLGGSVIIFEKENLGGTCLNVGCIPAKCLLEKAVLVDKIRKNTLNGILKDAGLFSWRKIQRHKDEVVHKLRSGVKSILKSYKIEVVQGKASVESPGIVKLENTGQKFAVKNIIIATGSKSYLPPIKGAEGKNIIDSTGALSLKKVPKSMAIIGGGVVGLEFASIYSTFGTNVTIIEMLPEIIYNEDREAAANLRKEIQKKGIKVVTGAKVEEISDAGDINLVKYSKENKSYHSEAEYVLVAAGRVPDKEGIDVERLGIELDTKGNIKVNSRLETNIKTIYAVGDVIGGFQLAHSAYAEAEVAAENCMGGNVEVNLNLMPRCIYTLPQYAAVGLTEEQAKEKKIPYNKGVFPYSANGKALASDDTEGFIKVLSHKDSGKLIGVHIVGSYATELISSALISMSFNAGVKDFYNMIFPHPTLSEIVKEAVLSTEKRAIHLPNRS